MADSLRAADRSYAELYRAGPLERIGSIRGGVSAADAKRIFADLAISQAEGFRVLNLPTATVNKKARRGEALSQGEGERVLGLARLVGQLDTLVEQSGLPEGFDARRWLARWLDEPLAALGGLRPAALMDTMEGQGLVAAALGRVGSGAYM